MLGLPQQRLPAPTDSQTCVSDSQFPTAPCVRALSIHGIRYGKQMQQKGLSL